MTYKTILIDPPWDQTMSGQYKSIGLAESLPYPTMTMCQIRNLPINDLADVGCHLWLWTTNEFLSSGFDLMKRWGFKYLAPVHWIKPNGIGNYFLHRSQTLLFGYKQKCIFNRDRYMDNIIVAPAYVHSRKPQKTYVYIESISEAPRLELFARRKRNGWDVWGNEVECDINLEVK